MTEKNSITDSIILMGILLMMTVFFPMAACADVGGICAEGVDNYDHNYTLSGDGTSDMIAVATAQYNNPKTGAGYGYHSGGWCAAFINDCAFLAGQADAIPFISGHTHDPTELRNTVLNRGGQVVSSPQGGDLVFYSANGGTSYAHVGLMIDTVYCINGNHNGTTYLNSTVSRAKYTEVNAGQTPSFVRPAYVPGGQEMTTGNNRVIPDGDYMIVTAGSTDKANFYYLDIDGADCPAVSGTNVRLTGPVSYDMTSGDTWTVTYNPSDKFYTIKQKGAEIALEVGQASKAQGANVRAYTANDSLAQKWAISHNGRSGYRVQAACSGFSMDIASGNIANGANIQQWSGNDTDAQSWLFIPYKPAQTLADGRYVIQSEVDQTYGMYVPGGSEVSANQVVQIWDTGTADSACNVFEITRLDNGYYKIIHEASGMAMEVYKGGSTIGEYDAVTMHEWNGTNPQQWAIMKNGYNGGYMLWCRSSGYPIDLRRRETGNGKPLRQYPWNSQTENGVYGSNAMTWRFESAGSAEELALPLGLKQIKAEAFAGIAAKVVRVPQGCTTIGSGAFRDCPNLTTIYIPASVTSIANDAFQNSPNVKIYGKSGSEALRYAQSSGISYSLY